MNAPAALSAWWAAWKWVAILIVLLALSLWLNVHQYGQRVAAFQEGRAVAIEASLGAAQEIARLAKSDNTKLLDRLDKIAARGERNRTTYSKAAAEAPLPTNCVPGQARVDALNKALGPQE